MGGDPGKNYDHMVAVAHTSFIWYALAGSTVGESSSWQETIQRLWGIGWLSRRGCGQGKYQG